MIKQSYSVLLPLAPWESIPIVQEALRSLRLQTLTPSQVVVSCDGSPPPLLLQCLKASELPIEIILGPGDEGVGPVLARGLLHCSEEFVIRADADDISHHNRAFIQTNWLKNYPDVIVMGTNINEFIIHPDQTLIQRWVPFESHRIRFMSMYRNPINHPSVIFRKSAILSLGNYNSMPGFEDYELWLRVLKFYGSSALANIHEPLVYVRVGKQHLSRRHGIKYFKSEMKFYFSCGLNKLLPWPIILIDLLIRAPLRLLPKELLLIVMHLTTRNNTIKHSAD